MWKVLDSEVKGFRLTSLAKSPAKLPLNTIQTTPFAPQISPPIHITQFGHFPHSVSLYQRNYIVSITLWHWFLKDRISEDNLRRSSDWLRQIDRGHQRRPPASLAKVTVMFVRPI
jgi:hypothetical protein